MADIQPPIPYDEKTPDLEQLGEKFVAGLVKKGGFAALLVTIIKDVIGLFAAVLGFFISVVDALALLFGKGLIRAFDAVGGGPLETILTIALEEFKAALQGSAGRFSITAGSAHDIASLFIDRITDTSARPGPWGLEPTIEPARVFMATMTEVGMRGWAMDLIAELASLGQLRAFEDLIGTLSRTLGFSRLARVALKPIVQGTIGDPAQAYINATYRPTLLSEASAAKLVIRGGKSRDWLETELGRKGYAADRIDAIVDELSHQLTIAEIDSAYRHQLLSLSEAQQEAKNLGYSDRDANLALAVADLARTDQLTRQQLAEYLTLFKAGEINSDAIKTVLINSTLPLEEQDKYRALIDLIDLHPHHELTIAQLNEAVTRNIITLAEFRDHLAKRGYGEENATILELLLQRTLNDKEDAARQRTLVKQQKADALAAKKQAALDAAAAKKAAADAAKAQRQQDLLAKQQAADAAHLARIKFTEDALAARHQLLAQAQADQLLTAAQATTAAAQLAQLQAEHQAQATAHAATVSALDAEQTAIDAAAVQERVTADKVAATTTAAKKRAALDQQLLDARAADRVAGYQLARDSAQASFDAGEITAAALAKKLRAIDLQEQKDVAAENLVQLQLTKAQQAADAAVAKGAVDVAALQEKAVLLPPATRRRQDAIAAALSDHLTTIATVGTACTVATAALTAKRQAANDAATARRAALDAQLEQQRLELEQQIAANRPKP
jgi:hypothetical protein